MQPAHNRSANEFASQQVLGRRGIAGYLHLLQHADDWLDTERHLLHSTPSLFLPQNAFSQSRLVRHIFFLLKACLFIFPISSFDTYDSNCGSGSYNATGVNKANVCPGAVCCAALPFIADPTRLHVPAPPSFIKQWVTYITNKFGNCPPCSIDHAF